MPVPGLKFRHVTYSNKKAVLWQGEPRDAAVNFDTIVRFLRHIAHRLTEFNFQCDVIISRWRPPTSGRQKSYNVPRAAPSHLLLVGHW